MSEDSPDLSKKIEDWLETQGYPLEMRVANAFQEAGFRVIQSDYYVDPSSNESREIDIVSYEQDSFDGHIIRITFAVECKSSKGKPWILFTTPGKSLAAPARVAQRAASPLARMVLRKVCQESEMQNIPIFDIPFDPAYSITQAFTSGHDVCYSAISSVATAALAKANASEEGKGLRVSPEVFEIVFPVIVTDAKLFSASLTNDQTINVKPKDKGVLVWRNPVVGMPHTVIHVVNIESLASFALEAKESSSLILALCMNRYCKTIESFSKIRKALKKRSSALDL